MTSERQVRANRVNAKSSTGPKSVSGKARAARNARTHGLNSSVILDPPLAEEVKALALKILETTDQQHFELVAQIAEAEIDLRRIRQIRRDLLAQRQTDYANDLHRLDRYERTARARRRAAMRSFRLARHQPPPEPSSAVGADDLE
jgi:hypothetical protein